MALQSCSAAPGEAIITAGEMAKQMYVICRGEVEVIDRTGKVVRKLGDGDSFGEVGVLMSTPRTATVRARTQCDLFVLKKADFSRILQDYPHFAEGIIKLAKERFDLAVSSAELMNSTH
jgi:CRP-like cAMP-binding protein